MALRCWLTGAARTFDVVDLKHREPKRQETFCGVEWPSRALFSRAICKFGIIKGGVDAGRFPFNFAASSAVAACFIVTMIRRFRGHGPSLFHGQISKSLFSTSCVARNRGEMGLW
jgi:hypothetical protein